MKPTVVISMIVTLLATLRLSTAANASITGTSGKNDLTLTLDTPLTLQICTYNSSNTEASGNNIYTVLLHYPIRGLKENTTCNITIECENGTNTICLSAMTAAGFTATPVTLLVMLTTLVAAILSVQG